MPHSFGCKATDWHCSVSSIRTMFLKGYVISTFCAVVQVDLVCDTCMADSLKV